MKVIDALLKDSTFGTRIDANRIGAAGLSLGGYTMIEIAGGITDPAAFMDFCASPKADGLCRSPPEFPTLVRGLPKTHEGEAGIFTQRKRFLPRSARAWSICDGAPLGPALSARESNKDLPFR